MNKQRLVQTTAEELRALILAGEPGTQIGSLDAIAKALGVGIVTVQQAARVLEQEGLLAVRRGPNGGYYRCRPDISIVTHALDVYCRSHGIGVQSTPNVLALLDREIVAFAVRNADERFGEELDALTKELELCESSVDRARFEAHLRSALCRVASDPLIEVISQLASRHIFPIREVGGSIDTWRDCRRRLLHALQRKDVELAKFEIDRCRQATESDGRDR